MIHSEINPLFLKKKCITARRVFLGVEIRVAGVGSVEEKRKEGRKTSSHTN